jgi:hypothetical protein
LILRGFSKLGLILLFCSLLSCQLLAQDCDQIEGNLRMQTDLYDEAFAMLKNCENQKGATGETLANLAILYGVLGYGDLPDRKARAHRLYILFVAAAQKGNEDAIVTLANVYEYGEPLLSISPQPKKENCLLNIVENSRPPFDTDRVKACLEMVE